jgi:phosphotransferase system HPr (HPr) family protein
VKAAKAFSSDIVVIKGDTRANAKSSPKLMTHGTTKGDRLIIRAEGEDEEAAIFDAHIELVQDAELAGGVAERVRSL